MTRRTFLGVIVASTGIGKLFPVVEPRRKLKATWTIETAKDFNAYHSVEAENDLIDLLRQQLLKEGLHDQS